MLNHKSVQRNAGCRQEEVKELLQLLAAPGTDLQPELLFCGSSFHGNVAPVWDGGEHGGSSPQQSLGSKLSLPGRGAGQSLGTALENGVS